MRILLDECVPWPMHRVLAGHECSTAQKRGWAGIKNGELLRLAEAEFDLFVTADQGIRYQQSLIGRKIAILELSTNDLRRILSAGAEFSRQPRHSSPVNIVVWPSLDCRTPAARFHGSGREGRG